MMDPNPHSALAQTWTFFRQWLKNPRGVAAISPSSQQLARQMMSELPRGARRVIELGGGTGVLSFFAAQKAAKVYCVEYNPDMVREARKFLAMNPNGLVPTLRDGDLIVWDNRCTIHSATGYDYERYSREMWRLTLLDPVDERREEIEVVEALTTRPMRHSRDAVELHEIRRLAIMVGSTEREVERLLAELEEAGVFSRVTRPLSRNVSSSFICTAAVGMTTAAWYSNRSSRKNSPRPWR